METDSAPIFRSPYPQGEYLTYKEWKLTSVDLRSIRLLNCEYLTYKEWKHDVFICINYRAELYSKYLTYKEWKHLSFAGLKRENIVLQ